MTRRSFVIFIFSFFVLWTGTWLLHQLLVLHFGLWDASQSGRDTVYWASMKFVVWVLFPWLYWRKRISNIRDFIGLSPSTIKRGYRWGSVATVVWVILILSSIVIRHQHFTGVSNWPAFIYTILLTPIVEEIMFRGFIISGLLVLKVEEKRANVITTLLFVLIHVVGWSFQGVLVANLTSTAWLSIALVSMIAGFIRIHSGSLRASILLHIGNNTIAGFLA